MGGGGEGGDVVVCEDEALEVREGCEVGEGGEGGEGVAFEVEGVDGGWEGERGGDGGDVVEAAFEGFEAREVCEELVGLGVSRRGRRGTGGPTSSQVKNVLLISRDVMFLKGGSWPSWRAISSDEKRFMLLYVSSCV